MNITPKTKKILGISLVVLAVVALSGFYMHSNNKKDSASKKPKSFKDGDIIYDPTITEAGNYVYIFYKGGWYIFEDVNLDAALADKAFMPITRTDFISYPVTKEAIGNFVNPADINIAFIDKYGI